MTIAIEPVTDAQIATLRRMIGPVAAEVCRLADVDASRGRGVLGPNDRCLWTRDGCRIVIAISEHGLVASVTKLPDEEAPPHVD